MTLFFALTACTSTLIFDYGDKDSGDTGPAPDSGDTDTGGDTDSGGDTDTDSGGDTDTGGGGGGTATSLFTADAGFRILWVYAPDIDQDGRRDIVLVSGEDGWAGGLGRPLRLHTAMATGADGFGAFTTYDLGFGPGYGFELHFADLDDDGDLDAMGSLAHGATLLLGSAAGLEAPHNPNYISGHALALGDLEGDGDLDAVSCSDDGWLMAFRNEGDATFGMEPVNGHCDAQYETARPSTFVTDFDGDGLVDYFRMLAGMRSVPEVAFGDELVVFDSADRVGVPAEVDAGWEFFRFVSGADPALLTTVTMSGGELRPLAYRVGRDGLTLAHSGDGSPGVSANALISDVDGDGHDDLVTTSEAGGVLEFHLDAGWASAAAEDRRTAVWTLPEGECESWDPCLAALEAGGSGLADLIAVREVGGSWEAVRLSAGE